MPADPPDRPPSWIASRRALWVALALGLALSLPSLGAGWFADDYAHAAWTELAPPGLPALDLFRLMDGSASWTRPLMDRGLLPWWTAPGVRAAFFRPLSSALLQLDHALFGRGTVGPHAHSILWSLALVAAVCCLLRHLFPTALGGLALLLFVLDDARVIPTVWLANRNALVAATLGVTGLWLHVRARESGRALSLASIACLATALLAGEVALSVIAYLGAYELVSAPGRLPRRIQALLPAGALGLAWAVPYKLLGYGASGSGLYLDPLVSPAEWTRALLSRFPALVGSMLLGAPADAWMITEAAMLPLIGAGLVAMGLFVWLLRSAWPHLTGDERRHTRWLLLGSALSLLPVTCTLPSSRVLLVPGIGGAAAIAVALRHLWSQRRSVVRRDGTLGSANGAALLLRSALVAWLALVHVAVAAALWPLDAYAMRQHSRRSDTANKTIGAALGRERARKTLLMLWAPPWSLFETPARLSLARAPLPKAVRTLSTTPGDHLYTRTGPGTLELELSGGRLLSSGPELAFRRRSTLRAGDRVVLAGMRVDVLAADEGGVRQVRFTFDVPLDDPSLVLFATREDGAVERIPVPPVGARWVVKPPSPWLLL